MFVTDSGTAIPIANTLDILTSIAAAGSIPIQTTGATNVVTIHAQKTQAIASTDATKIGLSAFDSSEFSVDANGFVTLAGGSVTETLTGNSGGAVAPNGSNNIFTVGDSTGITVVGSPGTNTLTWSLVGGGIAIQSVDVDAHTAPGTDPVVPNASGQIVITGAQVAAGTTTNVIRTDSLAANTFTIEVQRSQAVVATTIGDNGVSHFNSAMFSVDANGFVSLAGGGQAIDSIAVQTGTSPIVPTVAGLVTINGATVAAGTNPVRTDGTGANTMAVEVQISQAIAAADATKIGLSNFDSARFTVAATGFVSLNGAGVGQTITGQSGGALSPTAGNWNIFGASTAAGTSPVVTSGSVSTLTVNVQKAQAIASTDATKVGLAAFNSADFTVDTNGFVTATATGTLTTLTGDTGGAISPTAGNINVIANVATLHSGSSVSISGSGSTLTLNLSDASHNTIMGVAAGNATLSGSSNTSIGYNSVTGLTSGINNTALGAIALDICSSGSQNTAVGYAPGQFLTTGSYNTLVGYEAGNNYVSSESSNICIGSFGTAAESNVIRIGTQGAGLAQQNTCYIAGIVGVTAANAQAVFINSSTGQLGVIPQASNGQIIIGSGSGVPLAATITAGTGISVTNGANSITIAVASGTSVVQTLTGNSGGAISPTAGNINTVGTGSITIAGSGSTLTTQLTGLTNHNVLIGAGTATITNVAPSATSGVPLISQGASADPVFGTAVVAGGGTGAVTFTAYSVICAGTTATNPFQNVSGLGNAGQVLTSNGAAALPTWQSAGASVVAVTTVNHAASTYTVLSTDYFLAVDTSGGVVTLNLPNAPSTGKVYVIKDSKGTSATSAITVTTTGGAVTIDGATSQTINVNYRSISVVFDGTSYEIY